jgi:membrane fusion protein, multidrug efflux system
MAGNNNHKINPLFLLLALFSLAVAVAAVYYFHNLNYVTTDDAYIEGKIYTIAAKIPGTVKQVFVEDNQLIKKGDRLIEVDPVDYEVKVNEAQAAVNAELSRQANAQAAVNAAQAQLEIQEATLKQAQLDLQRAQKLVQEGALPQEKLDRTQTAQVLATAQVKSANEQIVQAKTALDLAAAVVKQRQASLTTAQLNLQYTKLVAPADGHITKKSVEAGNQIQAGQPLLAVVSLTDIWIVANYKETQLKNIHPGQKVRIKVDTYPRKVFTGKVESIMAGTGSVFSLFPPENAVGSYVKVVQRVPVKIVFDNFDEKRHTLRVGMSVVPTIITRDE